VSFKDADGKYLPPISTKKKTEDEAREIAFVWLRDGIPQNKNMMRVNDLSLKDFMRSIKSKDEAETALAELRRMGWVKGFTIKETPAAEGFIPFMTTFWDWDTSPYIKEKLRKNHGIHRRHCKMQKQAVALHWEPFFQNCLLGNITAKEIDDFINHMAEKDLSAGRKNVIIKAGFKPLRWAFSKGMIETDPSRGHILFSGDEVKRQILTPIMAAAIFKVEWVSHKAKLANILAAVTGMRVGEIIALRFKNLGTDCLFVDASWNKEDKDKTTKTNESRKVEVPFPGLMNGLMEIAKMNPWGVSPESYVFWSGYRCDIPMHGTVCIDGLRRALILIGLTKEQAEGYTFHGWRHFFTAYMVGKLDKKLLKGETGHKTDIMFNHYADHETIDDRKLIQISKKETFGKLLPKQSKMLVLKKERFIAVAK